MFFGGIELLAVELGLFAAVSFLVGGLDDLAVDFLWIARAFGRRSRSASPAIHRLSVPDGDRPMAVFVPAWDEADVIAKMLAHTLDRFEGNAFRLFVGCYPNDPATIAEARTVAEASSQCQLVVSARPGPTTKADCLNALWAAMRAHEEASGLRFAAVVLHDAEDVVHRDELGLFAGLIGEHAVVQLPVVPLVDKGSRWISGHYCDEFAEAHAKDLVVRQMLGAGLPTAGVGCAIERDMLGAIAEARGGDPFDADSLTEDYELGLRVAERGARSVFVRARSDRDGSLVAVRAHFPATLSASVRQKCRWITGIALMGWDRLGWRGGFAELWMRLRDRRSILTALVLFAAYVSLVMAATLFAAAYLGLFQPQPLPSVLVVLLQFNAVLLVWRLAMRAMFTARAYGWREGLRAVPRALVSNVIAMVAARRAFTDYFFSRRDAPVRWDKTRHVFPADAMML